MNLIIRLETPEDISAIYQVNQLAFDRENEARLVDNLRSSGAIILSLVAQMDDRIIGHILFSPVTVTNGELQWISVALGPMAVLPAFHNQGIGSALIRAALKELKTAGHDVVIVLGHSQYYPRFGFKPSKPFGIQWEGNVPEDVFMVLELRENALNSKSGIVRYHSSFKDV